MDIRALIIAVIGVILILLAGLFPHPVSAVAYVTGAVLAVVGAALFFLSLIRGSRVL
ncbi:MAG: hypothetical protein ACRD0P_10990 [Stackebrandtia sp.]